MPQEDQFGTYMYTINDLRPYSRYRIRLRAENRLGTSVPSIPSGISILHGLTKLSFTEV